MRAYNPKYKIKNYVQEAPVGSVVEIDGYEYYYCPTCKGSL